MKYKHYFWDWNGTLLDDAHAAFLAVNAMLSARNLPQITFKQYREYVDVPIVRFYEKVMDMSKESMENLSVEFNDLWKKYLSVNPIFDGVVSVLETITKNGGKNYIFSSSKSSFIKPFLEEFNLTQYFTAVLGAEDCYVGSKIERTCNYISNNQISVNEILIVGDMVHDSETAKQIGADCILVSCGHQDIASLKTTEREIIPSVSYLSNYLKEFNCPRSEK